LTVARGLDPAARQHVGAGGQSIDVLYEVALTPAAGQAELVERIQAEHLTRSEVRRIAGAARAARPKTRGRPSASRPYRETIRIDELGATITIAFARTEATAVEILHALRLAAERVQSRQAS